MIIHLALVDGRMRGEISSDHLSADHLAAFLDGRLTGSDRERAVRHFASCGACREELTELRDMLPAARPASTRRWIAAAAAAILAVVMIPRFVGDRAGEQNPRVRTEQEIRLPDGTNAIMVVSPPEESTLPPMRVELLWRPAGVGATYTVAVLDSSGTEVWKRTSLADTSISVPETIRLNPGSRYFWSVDARLADGTTAKSGAHTFIVR